MNFLPSETHPFGRIEFQTVLLLLMAYLVITGNSVLAASNSPRSQAAQA